MLFFLDQAAPWFRDAVVFNENISHQLDVIGGVKAHSIIFKTDENTDPYAFFLQYRSNDGSLSDPEIYPRPSNAYLNRLFKINRTMIFDCRW